MELFDLEAEKAALGAVLIDNSLLEKILDDLNPEHFSSDDNKAIYNAMIQIYLEDKIIDTVTLINKVAELGYVVSSDHILDVRESIINIKNHGKYVDIIYDLYLKRELKAQIDLMLENINISKTMDIVSNFQDRMLKALNVDKKSEIVNLRDDIDKIFSIDNVERDIIKTGFKRLNEFAGGFTHGEVVIVAARPGVGKTSIALNLLVDMVDAGRKCIFFSVEQPKEEIVRRIINIKSNVGGPRLRSSNIYEYERDKLKNAVSWVKHNDIYIDDDPVLTINKVKSKLRKFLMKNKLDVIFIDYIQLMSGSGSSRKDVIGEIARDLKKIAKEFNVLVVPLCQLNRDIEKRGKDAKPVLSDLKESGEIEQSADKVFFLDRDFYDPENNKCDFILAKNRHGGQCNIKLLYKKDCFKFYNIWKEDL